MQKVKENSLIIYYYSEKKKKIKKIAQNPEGRLQT